MKLSWLKIKNSTWNFLAGFVENWWKIITKRFLGQHKRNIETNQWLSKISRGPMKNTKILLEKFRRILQKYELLCRIVIFQKIVLVGRTFESFFFLIEMFYKNATNMNISQFRIEYLDFSTIVFFGKRNSHVVPIEKRRLNPLTLLWYNVDSPYPLRNDQFIPK